LSNGHFLFSELTIQRINQSHLFPAIRAEFEIPIDIFATIFTASGRLRFLPVDIRPKSIAGLLTVVAYDKWLPFFDSEYRNKKQAEVVVGALVIRLMQAANRTSAWILIQNFYFGCNTGDEDHGQSCLE
jgi:hypothetical protein